MSAAASTDFISGKMTYLYLSFHPHASPGPEPDAAASCPDVVPLIPAPTDVHRIRRSALLRHRLVRVFQQNERYLAEAAGAVLAYICTLPRTPNRPPEVHGKPAKDAWVGRRVQALRDGATARNLSPAGKTPPFSWPSDINKRAATREDLHLRETAFWRMPAAYRETEGPLRAAERDFHLKAYEAGIAEAKLLTTARVACWDTHLGVIKKIAHSELDVGIVLEDDVDMERDIKERLAGVWEALPSTWDMVFFGHCWSNETYYPAVGPNLYPSRSPKCTHGYALSRTGARKLFMHLVYPPFAYSRAIDQAYAWLIKSKRIESYSISPSIIVQRKVGVSDVMKGKGSRWRDTLVDGVFRT